MLTHTLPETQPFTAQSIVKGVSLVPMETLPPIWQDILEGRIGIGHPDKEYLVALVRLFYTKATDGSAEIFSRGHDLQSFYVQAAHETLEFFGEDYRWSSYPDWDVELATATAPAKEARRVVSFVKEVFGEFGYELPSSFYRMLLSPIHRESIHTRVALAFAPETQGVKRPYDAWLHAFNVTEMLFVVQLFAMCYGFRIKHACGCEHELTRHETQNGFVMALFGRLMQRLLRSSKQQRKKMLTAYIWRGLHEYMFFRLQVQSKSLAL